MRVLPPFLIPSPRAQKRILGNTPTKNQQKTDTHQAETSQKNHTKNQQKTTKLARKIITHQELTPPPPYF